MTVAVRLQDELDTTSPCGPAGPCPAGAKADTVATSISWTSARSGYWPVHRSDASPGLILPGPVLGVACLVFGVGVSGAGWVDRLACSRWFAGLEPQPEDLARVDGEPAGRWCLPASCAESQHDVAGAARAFFEHGPLPNAPLATVAVMPDAGHGDLAAALGLVAALRELRCGHGCRTAVVVTVDGVSSPALLALVRAVRDLGAFVVRAGMAAEGDHLHHFPLWAAMIPRAGHLVCVDLADHLATWPPGGVADLHVIPAAYDAAEAVFRSLADAGRADGGAAAQAANPHMHLDADAPGSPLAAIDRLATSCQTLLMAADGNLVFTDTERLDGTTATADLLIVR